MFRRRFITAVLVCCTALAGPWPGYAAEDELVLGVFPRRSAKLTIRAFTPLATYLSHKLNRPVVVETAADFDAFWKGVSALRFDIVHFNQYHYIRSHKTLGYEVIAMNEEFGRATIAGAIDVRKDSNIQSLAQLKGKKIIFGGDSKAMMSYIVPRYLLMQAGLQPGDYQEEFAKSPPNAILAVYFGQASAAGVGDTVLDMSTVKGKCDTNKIAHLARSMPLAQLPWAVKGATSVELRERVQQLLVNMKDSAEGRAALRSAKLSGLLPANDADYDQHREIVRQVLNEQL